MIKYVFIFCFLLFANSSKAHQPDISSTMLIEQAPNKWVLQIRASLTAFEQEVDVHFGKDAFSTPEEFQALVLEHIKNNISILFNAKESQLENGYVKLGHETSVVFELTNTSETPEIVAIKNTSFVDIHHNKSAVIVHKKGIEKDQFFLSAENQHAIKLSFENDKLVVVSPKEHNNNWLYILIIGLLAIIGFFFWNRSNSSLNNTN